MEDGRDSRDSGLGSITEYVTGARAKSNVFDAESDINQVSGRSIHFLM